MVDSVERLVVKKGKSAGRKSADEEGAKEAS